MDWSRSWGVGLGSILSISPVGVGKGTEKKKRRNEVKQTRWKRYFRGGVNNHSLDGKSLIPAEGLGVNAEDTEEGRP